MTMIYVMGPDNAQFEVAQLEDEFASDGTFYFSLTMNKLVFKDLAGVVNALY